ncbi:MAG: 50S ribosomal protein L19 [Chloroflexi bacterium]|nr:50S ribosomal protein L19 [Chloroflexota bacterium]
MPAVDLRELAPERNAAIPEFAAGDTVRVSVRVVEGERERVQPFEGVVLRVTKGPGGSFTVRRIASGVGVERSFPLASRRLVRVEVMRRGRVRRSRLYYLRGRTGRAARVKEARRAPGGS